MAAKKKKMAKKKVVKKVIKTAVKKAVKNKPVNKKVTKKAASNNNKIKVTLGQRHKMICKAAYYISLDKTYETVNPTDDWLQAEFFINQICTVHTK